MEDAVVSQIPELVSLRRACPGWRGRSGHLLPSHVEQIAQIPDRSMRRHGIGPPRAGEMSCLLAL